MEWWALVLTCLIALVSGQADVVCYDGVFIITARATAVEPGFGSLVTMKNILLQKIPGSGALALPYPADKGEEHYLGSVMQGIMSLTQIIKDYADKCPDHGIVLMGNSQGAHVVGDTLAGFSYDKYPQFGSNPGLDQKYLDSIAAAIMMGDPSNAKGQPIIFGNSTHDGFHPRKDTGAWARKGLVEKVRSYCDDGDLFCDGGKDVDIHIGYFRAYRDDAVQFILDRSAAFDASHGSIFSKTHLLPFDPSASPKLGPKGWSQLLLIVGIGFVIIFACRSYIRPAMLGRGQASYLPFMK